MYKNIKFHTITFLFFAAFLVFSYSIENGGITGAAIFELEKEENFQGIYSIKPSFKVDVDYDLDEYEELRKKSEKLLKECKDKNDINSCIINEKSIFNNEDFELIDLNEPEDKENFYKSVEYIKGCIDSKTNSCICTTNNPSGKGSLTIDKEGNKIVIRDKYNDKLKETIGNVQIIEDHYEFTNDVSYIHKDHDNKVLVSGYWDLKTCDVVQRNIFRFNAKSKKNKFYVYDDVDKKFELRNVIYKFALDFGEKEIQPYTVPQVKINDAIKNLFKDKRVVIAAECIESKKEVFSLAEELAKLFSQTDALTIAPIGEGHCDVSQEVEPLISKDGSTILIILSAEQFDEGVIEYHKDSEKSKEFSDSILDKIFHFNGFSEYTELRGNEILSNASLSAQIIFTDTKIKEDNDYANAVFSGIVDYIIKTESADIIFEYFDVKNPSGIRMGLVDLGWVWESAKKENINYHLLSAIIQTESSFVNLNKLDDGKAHGLGQQFPAAIKDIHPDLTDRYPIILAGKTSEDIYEDVLTSEDESSLKIQIAATSLYLKWTKNALAQQGKPTDAKTIIRAYHDGVGNIMIDGTSKLADEEAKTYVAKVENNYNILIA